MDVVKSLPGVKITIWSDDRQLKEYRCKTELPRDIADSIVSRFIEATTEAEFYFKICVSQNYQLDSPNLLFDIYVDGKSVGGVVCGEYELITGKWTKKVEGVKQPTEKRNIVGLRKFKFSELIIEKKDTNLAKLTKDGKYALRIGELQVLVYRCSSFYTLPRGPTEVLPGVLKISENAAEKHEISHGTVYSPTKRILEDAVLFGVTYVDGEDSPVAVYNFRYRSKDILKRELLRQTNEDKTRHEMPGLKRKRNERMEEGDINLSDDSGPFVAAPIPARKARKLGEHTEIEPTSLIDDLDED